jgi:REP element-mobilizing transposase RayT
MPRCARIKPDDTGTYYHLTNRIAGMPGDFPFDDVEKQKMVSFIKELSGFFTVEVLAFQVMGNHTHVVCFAPADVLPAGAAAERYNRFYGGIKPFLRPDDPYCLTVAEQMRDVSHFMGRLQQRFTSWFNRTRTPRRRGTLWAQRFKSVILERDTALWNCLCYVEMNAVRAGLVSDAADYRFGSWGEWCGTGRHPFGESLRKHLTAYEGETARARTLDQIQQRFRVEFARLTTAESGACTGEIDAAMQQAAPSPSFVLRLDRRVRYWTDGLIIGSKTFVRETAARVWDADRVERHRLQRAHGPTAAELYAYRRLHAIPC